jgi:RNA polymerase sigma-70 factor (ECF subfamily)
MDEDRDPRQRPSGGSSRRLSDEAWLRRCISEHGEAVYGMARRIVADAHIAEEVARDTFVELWRRPERFDPHRGSLRTLLVVAARNKAVDAVRRPQPGQLFWERIGEEGRAAFSPDRTTQIEQRSQVAAALHQLSTLQRGAVSLAFYGGLTYREVAHRLQIPEGTARKLIRDGLIRLRDELHPSSEDHLTSRSSQHPIA